MDKWIQSFTQSLIQFFKAEMDGETNWSSRFCGIIDRISGLQGHNSSFVKLMLKMIT